MKQNLSRRNFLKSSTVAAGASAFSFSSLFGFSRAFAQEASGTDDDLQTIINLAATAELFATTHYLAAINAVESGDLDLDDIELKYLKTAFIAEQDHYDLLVSLGAAPVVTEFYVPDGLFSDVDLFSTITEVAETTFVSAYLAATRIFVNMGQPAFAVTTAQIAAVEAEHRALVRQIGERIPNNEPYAQFQFNNVSDAVPVLQPVLDGSGDGFVGPVSAPSADDIAGIRAQADDLGYMSTTPYAAMETASDSSSSEMSSSVSVTARNQAVNIRREPTTNAGVVGTLSAGESTMVDGQRTASDGSVWWHVAAGGWVRSDTVNEGGDTSGLASM